MKTFICLVLGSLLLGSCAAGFVIGTNNKQSQEVNGSANVDSVTRPQLVIN